MSAAAPALLKKPSKPALSEAEARDIIGQLSMLVATSGTRIEPGTVVNVAYEVCDGDRRYTFQEQPFYIRRFITKSQYLQALPRHLRRAPVISRYYYEISTD